MKFLRKTPVAVVLTLLIVASCCVWGFSRVYDPSAIQTPSISTDVGADRPAGESNLNYYLDWIDDSAELLTLETVDAIARRNLVLDNTYGSFMAIQTVKYLNGRDIQTVAEETATQVGLGRRDLLLLIDSDTQGWYVTCGSQITAYVEADTELPTIFRKYLNAAFWQENSSDRVMLSLYDELEEWYANTIPPIESSGGLPFQQGGGKAQTISLSGIFNGILLTLLANLWWIVLVMIVLHFVDRVRFDRYYTRSAGGTDPKVTFRPFLFWHHSDSRWFERMMDQMEEEEDEEEPPPNSSGHVGYDRSKYQRGPGYSTDPNEPGPFTPPSSSGRKP